MKLGIARVIVFAKDMERMADFYGNVLGLARAGSPGDSAEWMSFEAGGCQLSLHAIPERDARSIVIENPPAAREGTPLKVAFAVADVEATRAELVSRGARMGAVRVFGDLQLCDGIDPEGNVFQISNRT